MKILPKKMKQEKFQIKKIQFKNLNSKKNQKSSKYNQLMNKIKMSPLMTLKNQRSCMAWVAIQIVRQKYYLNKKEQNYQLNSKHKIGKKNYLKPNKTN